MRQRHSERGAGAPRRIGRLGGTVVVALGMGALAATPAIAAHVARLDVSPTEVAPGGQVSVSAAPSGGYGDAEVTVRWDSLDGPILGTFPSDPFGPETVTIPADATPGRHVLIADQDVGENGTGVRGIPARAAIEVTGPGGAPADADQAIGASALPRLATLDSEGSSGWTLLSIALVPFVASLAVGALVLRRARTATTRP